jgi:molybdopterin-guanine dinucleotide biosynthesis protein A
MNRAVQARPALTGGILAGGEGARFGGADKGWLMYRGRSFVEHVRDALAPQVDDIVISANRNQSRYAALGHTAVGDDIGQGPAAGLLRLLEVSAHPWVLCVPCDALQLSPTLAREMCDAQWAEEADIVVVHDGADRHPTCCLVPTYLATDLRAYLKAGHTALWRWQARHLCAELACDSPFVNINDVMTLAALQTGTRS